MKFASFLGFVAILVQVTCLAKAQTFNNPIFDFNSADPATYRQKINNDVNYFISLSTSGERELTLYKSPRLSNFRNAESKVVYRAKEGESDLWASEIHEVFGEVYIYFSMRRDDHRVYALKADNPLDLLGGWSEEAIPMMADWGEGQGGIDLTVLKHGNGGTYASWVNGGAMWIGRFADNDGTKVLESRVRLRKDVGAWECCQNEGPYFFYNVEREVSYLAFSGGDTWSENYAIGYMSIPWNRDPMVPSNWNFGDEKAVFQKDESEQVYGPGHCGFTLSPDGTETWMIYHAGNSTNLSGNRIARIEKITFSEEDGKPIFPRPHGYNSPQPVPSGEIL